MLAAGSDAFSICKGGLPMRKIGLASRASTRALRFQRFPATSAFLRPHWHRVTPKEEEY
jgi:hypothetical protein